MPGYRPELGEAHESRGKGARGSAQLSAARAVAYIAILSLFAVVFWTGYEQSGGLLNLYIFEKVDRTVLGFAVPATWLLTLPAFFCILVGVAVAEALLRIEKHGVVLDPPRRFAGGLIVGALAFAVFAWAANSTDSALPVGWVFLFYFLLTIAELVLSPAGFSMVTRIAPRHLSARLMGLWLLSVAIGSALAGQVGAYSAKMPISMTFSGLALAFVVAGLLLLLCRRLLLLRIAG